MSIRHHSPTVAPAFSEYLCIFIFIETCPSFQLLWSMPWKSCPGIYHAVTANTALYQDCPTVGHGSCTKQRGLYWCVAASSKWTLWASHSRKLSNLKVGVRCKQYVREPKVARLEGSNLRRSLSRGMSVSSLILIIPIHNSSFAFVKEIGRWLDARLPP